MYAPHFDDTHEALRRSVRTFPDREIITKDLGLA